MRVIVNNYWGPPAPARASDKSAIEQLMDEVRRLTKAGKLAEAERLLARLKGQMP